MNKAMASGIANLLQKQRKHNNLGSVGGQLLFKIKSAPQSLPFRLSFSLRLMGFAKFLWPHNSFKIGRQHMYVGGALVCFSMGRKIKS